MPRSSQDKHPLGYYRYLSLSNPHPSPLSPNRRQPPKLISDFSNSSPKRIHLERPEAHTRLGVASFGGVQWGAQRPAGKLVTRHRLREPPKTP